MKKSQPPHSQAAAQQERQWREFVQALRRQERPFEEQWAFFKENFAGRSTEDGPPPIWWPGEEQLTDSNLGRFMQQLGFANYAELHEWSVRERGELWQAILTRLGIVFSRPPDTVLDLTSGVEDPRWLAGARMNIVDSCFTARPEKTAVISGREGDGELRETTYGELEQLVNRVANGLHQHGFEVGDAIALYMPMTTECVAAYLGIVRAGCRVVSIADSFSPQEVKRRLEIAAARGVVTVQGYRRGSKIIGLYDKVRQAAAPRTVVIPLEGDDEAGLRPGDLTWEEFLSPEATSGSVHSDPHEVTNVLFSSGTTGEPKAIPWTHLTPLKCGMDGHFHQDVRPGDVVAWPTNIGWMMGPWLIYAALLNDAAMALYEGLPTGDGFGRFVRDAQVSILGLVPALVRGWRSSGALEGIDWSEIRLLSSTGEPSNREDYLWLAARTGYQAPVIEYLGGTEIGGGHLTGTVLQPASPATFTTPALGIDFVILDEGSKPVAEGEMGELFLIPPAIGLSQRLLNRDHREVYYAGCPKGPGGEVLRRHGDHIARLARGYFKAQGRADDTMNLGGIKVSSLELEQVMDSHPAVYETAAVAVQPHGEGAEHLVVYATLCQAIETPVLQRELARMIAKKLNPLFKIHDLVTTDELPRTASNKLMRRTLRAHYLKERPT